MSRFVFLIALIILPLSVFAQDQETLVAEPAMTLDRLGNILLALDPEMQTQGNLWQININDEPVLIVTDEIADRMRVMVPIRDVGGIEPDEMTRMMQSNFDAALDARYAIAQNMLWAAFIHPLSPLEKNQLISGIGQVVNLAQSYGTLYTGGGMLFGGGDSENLQKQLIEELLKKGEEI